MRVIKRVGVSVAVCALAVFYFGVPSAVDALISTQSPVRQTPTGTEIGETPANRRTVETVRVGELCGIEKSGWDARDIETGLTLRCLPGATNADGYRWASSDDTYQTTPAEPSRGAGPFMPGKPCVIRYTTVNGVFDMTSPYTGERIRCTATTQPDGSTRYVWVAIADPGPVDPTVPELPTPDPDTIETRQPACTDTQFLPTGFNLPAGATIIEGSPDAFTSDEPETKEFRCRIEALMPANSDPETLNTFMADQCEANGWQHNPNLVGRYTVDPEFLPVPNSNFGPGDMIIGSCRTSYGSFTMAEGQPWYVNWSLTTYTNDTINSDPLLEDFVGKQAELMIEVRAFSA